jgi:hypothetical protein
MAFRCLIHGLGGFLGSGGLSCTPCAWSSVMVVVSFEALTSSVGAADTVPSPMLLLVAALDARMGSGPAVVVGSRPIAMVLWNSLYEKLINFLKKKSVAH